MRAHSELNSPVLPGNDCAACNDSHDGEISAGALIVRVKLFAGDSFRDTLQGLRECYEICFVQPFEHLKVPDENVPRLESEIRTFFSLFICQAGSESSRLTRLTLFFFFSFLKSQLLLSR